MNDAINNTEKKNFEVIVNENAKMVNKLNKNFYNTVLCQAFSPCGNYLIVGDIYGCLSTFHISKIIQPETNLSKDQLTPKHTVTVKENLQVNSLLCTHTHLIVGGVGEIYGYLWKTIKTSKNATPVWSIDIPTCTDGFSTTDINYLLYNEETGQLYAGCGDNIVYVIDIETRKILKTLQGHEDYIHSLSSLGTDLVSGGEDGAVIIWDLNTNNVVNKIVPSTDDKIGRPNLGKWIGGVSCNEDYLLCGGGPRLSLWHYRFLKESAVVFPIDDNGIHIAEIYNDRVFAGGRAKLFYQMTFNGDTVAEILTSAVTTYSAVHQEEPYKTLSIAGSSPKIDLCSNFMYRDQTLSLY